MSEKIEKIVELDIDFDELGEDIFDNTGVQIVSLVDTPAIEVDFMAFNKEKFIDPKPSESEDEFIGRCMGELENEYPDRDQRLAVCYSYYEGKLCKGECHLEFDSYTDYPESAKNNACRALKYAEENGWGSCGEATGKRRANQLCKGEPISRDTISRMASFKRHQQNKDVPYTEGCGGLMWDSWGGSSGINWASSKLKELEELSNEEHILSKEAQSAILKFCEDDNNGEYLTDEDIIIDLSLKEFSGVNEVIKGIRGLDILQRLVIKREEAPETYWRYSGPGAQRDFCKAMMRLSNSGKIFSESELDQMGSINAQFSPRGSSTYNKMAWKGGVNCVHYWQKLKIFRNENGNKVIILDGNPSNTKEENAMKSNNANKPSPLGSTANNARLNFSIDDEKRTVLGPLMIPNKLILRRDEAGNPYYIFFSKATIKKMAEKFLKLNKHNNTDINHDENIVTKNTLLESWISESIKYDKAYKYGYTLSEGTWYVSYKINDDDTWERIKNKELRGFSLAGDFIEKLKPVNKDEKTLSEIKNIIKQIKNDE